MAVLGPGLEVPKVGPELLAAAGELAGGGSRRRRVQALVTGPRAPEGVGALFRSGADEVVVAVAPWLAGASAEARVAAIAEASAVLQPACLLMGHDAAAWEVAPRLAVRLDAGLVTDCVALAVRESDGAMLATRPCFSGKALAEWVTTRPAPLIVTLRKGAFAAAAHDPSRNGEVRILELEGAQPATMVRTLSHGESSEATLRLEDADVVIGVGRGIGSKEEFQSYFRDALAPALGAACGGSRGAVDLGIVPPELQIGLTGRIVSPELYIAVGLSGSPQHMAGCSGARRIVAINTDPLAPIFSYADHGVVGDYREVVPALSERLRILAAGRG